MTRVLGIDPGSRKTGFGVIDVAGSTLHYVASGVIRLPTEESLPPRLQLLFRSLTELIEELRPDEVAIEQVFMAKSADAALKLGQARGAAIVAAVNQNLPVHEYEARKVKQAVVGTGAADKHQVKHMVMALLGLQTAPAEDASDALAVAICHINSRNSLLLAAAGAGRRFSRGRNRSA